MSKLTLASVRLCWAVLCVSATAATLSATPITSSAASLSATMHRRSVSSITTTTNTNNNNSNNNSSTATASLPHHWLFPPMHCTTDHECTGRNTSSWYFHDPNARCNQTTRLCTCRPGHRHRVFTLHPTTSEHHRQQQQQQQQQQSPQHKSSDSLHVLKCLPGGQDAAKQQQQQQQPVNSHRQASSMERLQREVPSPTESPKQHYYGQNCQQDRQCATNLICRSLLPSAAISRNLIPKPNATNHYHMTADELSENASADTVSSKLMANQTKRCRCPVSQHWNKHTRRCEYPSKQSGSGGNNSFQLHSVSRTRVTSDPSESATNRATRENWNIDLKAFEYVIEICFVFICLFVWKACSYCLWKKDRDQDLSASTAGFVTSSSNTSESSYIDSHHSGAGSTAKQAPVLVVKTPQSPSGSTATTASSSSSSASSGSCSDDAGSSAGSSTDDHCVVKSDHESIIGGGGGSKSSTKGYKRSNYGYSCGASIPLVKSSGSGGGTGGSTVGGSFRYKPGYSAAARFGRKRRSMGRFCSRSRRCASPYGSLHTPNHNYSTTVTTSTVTASQFRRLSSVSASAMSHSSSASTRNLLVKVTGDECTAKRLSVSTTLAPPSRSSSPCYNCRIYREVYSPGARCKSCRAAMLAESVDLNGSLVDLKDSTGGIGGGGGGSLSDFDTLLVNIDGASSLQDGNGKRTALASALLPPPYKKPIRRSEEVGVPPHLRAPYRDSQPFWLK